MVLTLRSPRKSMEVEVNGGVQVNNLSSGKKPSRCVNRTLKIFLRLRQSAATLLANGQAQTIQASCLDLEHVSLPLMCATLWALTIRSFASSQVSGNIWSFSVPKILFNCLPNLPCV